MAVITDDAIRFMADLWENNNKDWFDANRERYERVLRDPLKALRDELTTPVSLLLLDAPKPKISRINQDLRFHKDRPPYKEHMWISWVQPPAELMAALSRDGWSGVVAIGGDKDDLATWRQNLVTHHALWRSYATALGLGKDVNVHVGNPYKKPLFDDIPEDVSDLVQARQLYIYPHATPRFSASPESDLLKQMAMLLPAHLFATIATAHLPEVLRELAETVIPPDKRVAKVWAAARP